MYGLLVILCFLIGLGIGVLIGEKYEPTGNN